MDIGPIPINVNCISYLRDRDHILHLLPSSSTFITVWHGLLVGGTVMMMEEGLAGHDGTGGCAQRAVLLPATACSS